MKNVFTTPVAQGITRRAGLLTLLGSALALAGCGGGGDLAGLSSGGTGSFSVGPITGLGSIIVNGVRFDDSGASASGRITDDDGGLRSSSDLKLGMMVTVTGSAITRSTVTGDRATASAIVFGGELQGPISATTANPQTLTVLGQTVQITGSTIFDTTSLSGGFASLTVGNIVEVHGMVNPDDNTIQATFIERKSSPPAFFKIQGRASNHVGQKFTIGAILFNYSTTPPAEVRVIPSNGTLVRVRVMAAALPGPAEGWTATRIRPPENANEDRDEAEIEGSITAFNSVNSFSVNGIAVSTSLATRFENGSTADLLAVGVRVEVKGRLSAGVLIAERVKIEDSFDVDNLEFELHGTIDSLNTTAKTFVLRGVTVDYNGSVEFRDGIDTNLANIGLKSIEVKGVISADGTKVQATRISFD